MICLKIRTFVVSATTNLDLIYLILRCDLLENSYLCGISNNPSVIGLHLIDVVICLKIRTFVVSATTNLMQDTPLISCDLLENSYLCGISNNPSVIGLHLIPVVICLKIRTFVVSATTNLVKSIFSRVL